MLREEVRTRQREILARDLDHRPGRRPGGVFLLFGVVQANREGQRVFLIGHARLSSWIAETFSPCWVLALPASRSSKRSHSAESGRFRRSWSSPHLMSGRSLGTIGTHSRR